jgi:CubicO group peptidase (beta-lactamase class C family)
MRYRLRDDDELPAAPPVLPPDVPSAGPPDVPPDVPSDEPSDEPSDVPSDVPGDVPGDAPAAVPEWEALPASGPLVAIDVAWTDDEGRPHRASLESLLADVRTGEALPERDWVYVGGRFGPLRQGREVHQVHVADLNGNVVAIYLDGQGLCLFERNSIEGVDDTLYTIHPDNAPRKGTPATIVFSVTGRGVLPPPARKDDVLEGELAAALDERLAAAAARGFSGVVQVEQGGRPILRKAYGTLGPGGEPLPTDAVFPTGVLGRRMIATAVLDAARSGALSLDDVLARHVRDVPPDKGGVRLRHLLEDSSGMPENVPGAETIDRARALEALLAAPLLAAPGEACLPSRAGYALLLIALENAAEDVWRGMLGDRVFAPARMVDAGLWGEPRWDGGRLARGMLRRDETLVDLGTPAERLPTWADLGAGAVMASVRDLARFERAVVRGDYPEAVVRFTPGCEPVDGAWHMGANGCLVLSGRREGFACELRHWLDADLVLVLASNSGEPEVLPELIVLLDAVAEAEASAATAVPSSGAPAVR